MSDPPDSRHPPHEGAPARRHPRPRRAAPGAHGRFLLLPRLLRQPTAPCTHLLARSLGGGEDAAAALCPHRGDCGGGGGGAASTGRLVPLGRWQSFTSTTHASTLQFQPCQATKPLTYLLTFLPSFLTTELGAALAGLAVGALREVLPLVEWTEVGAPPAFSGKGTEIAGGLAGVCGGVD